MRTAIIRFGKIARDQHVSALAATSGLKPMAIASRNAGMEGHPGQDWT